MQILLGNVKQLKRNPLALADLLQFCTSEHMQFWPFSSMWHPCICDVVRWRMILLPITISVTVLHAECLCLGCYYQQSKTCLTWQIWALKRSPAIENSPLCCSAKLGSGINISVRTAAGRAFFSFSRGVLSCLESQSWSLLELEASRLRQEPCHLIAAWLAPNKVFCVCMWRFPTGIDEKTCLGLQLCSIFRHAIGNWAIEQEDHHMENSWPFECIRGPPYFPLFDLKRLEILNSKSQLTTFPKLIWRVVLGSPLHIYWKNKDVWFQRKVTFEKFDGERYYVQHTTSL